MNFIRPLALTLAVSGALMFPAHTAQATVVHAGVGSGVCKASDGHDTDLRFSDFYVANISTSVQYVTCNVEFIRERLVNLKPGAGYKLTMIFGSSLATPQNVTCTASVGHGGGAAVRSTKTVATSSLAAGRLDYSSTELRAFSDVDSLSVYCGLAPRTTIGLFITTQPEVNVVIP